VLAGAVILAFGASITASFQFDDHALLTDAAVTSPSGWRDVWRPEQTRPLTYFTFWLDYALWGQRPAPYHLFNLLVHLASALLLYSLLSKLIPGRRALVAAAIFAIHPIQTEPVVYIYARGTLLMTLFCLLSLRSWLRGGRWAATAWFTVALLAKEECAAFPLFLLLLEWSRSGERRQYSPIGAMLGLSLAAGLRVILVTAAVPGSGAGFGAAVSPLAYLAAQGTVIVRYFRLLIVPWGFTVDSEIPAVSIWVALVAWGAILAAALAATRRFFDLRAGFWFLGGLVLLLASSSVFPASDLAADRRVYLPLAAFSAMFALILQQIPWRALAVAGVALLLVTIERVQVWQTERVLWEEAVRRSPGKVRPKLQLSRVVEPQRALGLLREAEALSPADPRVATELGRTYLELGQTAEALAAFGRALALAPRDPLAYNNRGVALLSLGQREAARRDFERALALDPCLFEARYNLAKTGVESTPPRNCRFTPNQRKALRSAPAASTGDQRQRLRGLSVR